MGATASQTTSLSIVYSTVYSDVDQRKHQRSASLAFVWGIHRGPVNSPHKWPVTRKMFPFDDVIMRLPQIYALTTTLMTYTNIDVLTSLKFEVLTFYHWNTNIFQTKPGQRQQPTGQIYLPVTILPIEIVTVLIRLLCEWLIVLPELSCHIQKKTPQLSYHSPIRMIIIV